MSRKTLALLSFLTLACLAACAGHAPAQVEPNTPKHHVLGASTATPIGPSPVLGAARQYDSQGYINSDVVKASSGSFLGAMGSNKGASQLYFMWFNATSLPANGATPSMMPIPIPAGGTFSLVNTIATANAVAFGPVMSTGLVWAASTTATTLTVDSTNSVWVTVQYY